MSALTKPDGASMAEEQRSPLLRRVELPRQKGMRNASRVLELIAAAALLAILGLTALQLQRARAALIDETAEQMSRLDMVFAEQTGRAAETVDVILRDLVDTLPRLLAQNGSNIDATLARRIAGVRQVSAIAVADRNGLVLWASNPALHGRLPPAGTTAVAIHRVDEGDGLRISEPIQDGNGRWTVLMTHRLHTVDGTFGGIVVAFIDLSYFEDFYKAVELRENGSIILHHRDGTVLARFPRADGLIGTSYANQPPFTQVLSRGMAGTVGMISPIDGSERVLAIRALRTFPLAVSVSVDQERVLASWRREVWVFGTAAVLGGAGLVSALLLIAQRARASEMAHRLQAAEQLALMGTLDPLTGLLNRTAMNERLDGLLARAGPSGVVAVMFLDLDGFKEVNDGQGHRAGDAVLRVVAERLAQAGGPADVARWGGDEFVIVTAGRSEPGLAAAAAAMAQAQDVLRRVSRPINIGPRTVRIGATIGISIHPADGSTAEALVTAADTAMYAGKQAGGNVVHVHDPALAETMRQSLEIERELRQALKDEALTVSYQPIVDGASRQCVALEALLRWHDPVRGAVSPSVFIPVAEQSGLIGLLGHWTLERACLDATGWPGNPAPAVSVNVSLAQVGSGLLPQTVARALERSGLPACRLHLELTESMVGGDHQRIIPVLQAVRDMGVSIALDDFGTGFSSLSRLRAWPVDTIKIDGSFVRAMATEGTAVIRATLLVANEYGHNVIAEGVETEDQWQLLRQLGVRFIQGYLVSRPMEAHAVAGWLEETRLVLS